jgi:hypothetical protein
LIPARRCRKPAAALLGLCLFGTSLASQSAEPSVPKLDGEKIVHIGAATKTIELTSPEAVVGLMLPAGTEVRIDWVKGGRIIDAVLHEKVDYIGLELPPGTRLGLLSRMKQGQIMGRQDRLGEMWIVGLEQPADWRIGPLSVHGYVELTKQDGANFVRCFRPAICRYQKTPIFEARFRPDWQLAGIALANLAPIDVKVEDRTLKADRIDFWPDGKLRMVHLRRQQRFRGRTVSGDMRFWPGGTLQKLSIVAADSLKSVRYCRSGRQENPLRDPLPQTDRIANTCDDGSILYVDADLLCKRSDAARRQFDFLRDRPPGLLAECDTDYAETDNSGRYKVIYRDASPHF